MTDKRTSAYVVELLAGPRAASMVRACEAEVPELRIFHAVVGHGHRYAAPGYRKLPRERASRSEAFVMPETRELYGMLTIREVVAMHVPLVTVRHTKAAMLAVQRALYAGDKSDLDGFTGLGEMTNYSDVAGVIDAGGTEAGEATSIYLVRSAPGAPALRWSIGTDGLRIGLTIPEITSVLRIANVTPQPGHRACPTLLGNAVVEFVRRNLMRENPDAICLSARSLEQVREAWPGCTEILSVPLIVSGGIPNTDDILQSF